MNVLLIEETLIVTSTAPGKFVGSSVVCFDDSFFIVLHGAAPTYHVNWNPKDTYEFGDLSIPEGVQKIIDSCTTEEELKGKLLELVKGNTTFIVTFADHKKVKIKSLLGTKTLKASNNAMSYTSFNTRKDVAKQLMAFYPNF